MKRLLFLLTSMLWLALSGGTVQAALSYWDGNGSDPGAGSAPNGLWGSDPLDDNYWTYSSTGTGTSNTWVNGDTPVFSAGTDATFAFDVFVDGGFPPSVGGIIFEEGRAGLQNATITMTNDYLCPIICNANGLINSALGDISGTCGILKTGPGTLTLGGSSSYGGTNIVAEGVLSLTAGGASTPLGAVTVPTVVSNGATLENALDLGNSSEPLILHGNGVTNSGALRGMFPATSWTGGYVLGADARINYYSANGTWTLSGGYIDGKAGNFNLTFGGNGNVMRINIGSPYVDVGTGTITKDGTCILRLEQPSRCSAFYFNGGSIFPRNQSQGSGFGSGNIYVGAGAAAWRAEQDITLAYPMVLASGANPAFVCFNALNWTQNGVLSGAGGLTKTNSGTTLGSLFLNANNTYTGPTTIGSGQLVLGASGSISNSAVIDVQTGAIFNVTSNTSGFTLQTNQTLKGNGTVWGNVQTDGTLAPGASVGTLTFYNNLTIAGNLAIEVYKGLLTPNDQISVAGTLTNAGTGTLTVTKAGGSDLAVGDSFQIFNKPLLNGQALTVTGAGAVWTNKLDPTGNMTIQVLSLAAQKVPATNMSITAGGANSFNLQGYGGSSLTYNVYAYTNVAASMSSWWLLGTANANGSGVIQFTDTQATNKQRFYRFGQ